MGKSSRFGDRLSDFADVDRRVRSRERFESKESRVVSVIVGGILLKLFKDRVVDNVGSDLELDKSFGRLAVGVPADEAVGMVGGFGLGRSCSVISGD